jgi:hypothetical protein
MEKICYQLFEATLSFIFEITRKTGKNTIVIEGNIQNITSMTTEGSQWITSILVPEFNGLIVRTIGKHIIVIEGNNINQITMTT